MIWWQTLFLLEVVHNFFGIIIAAFMGCEGVEFANPIWIYNRYKVNVFGTIVLSIVFNLICPIGTVFYWLYKLCTVGRR